jgi:lipopolysaccharide transport system ATP-binding protein
VKRYSSGMYVRLAFAVAAHLEPEILIVDEVLAVGDAEFQKKCLGKMGEVARGGRTVLFVSHNMAAVERLCGRAVLLRDGGVVAAGSSSKVVSEYVSRLAGQAHADVDLSAHPGRTPGSRPLLRRLRIEDGQGRLASTLPMGGRLRISLLMEPQAPLRSPAVGIAVYTFAGQRVFTVHSRYSGWNVDVISRPTWVHCEIPEIILTPGRYMLKVAAGVVHEDYDVVENAAAFDVAAADFFANGTTLVPTQGIVAQRSIWAAEPAVQPRMMCEGARQ